MTPAELQAITAQLPANVLTTPAGAMRHLTAHGVARDPEAALAFILKAGWWEERRQFGVREVWRDGNPLWRAKKT